MSILPLAALGGIAGAITAWLVVFPFEGSGDYNYALYIGPGAVFGIAIGGELLRGGRLRLPGLVIYAAAATLANAAAVFLALRIFSVTGKLFASEYVALAVTGLISGAFGAALLTLASLKLLNLARPAWLVAVGALCGALLPLFVDGGTVGAFIFYIVWQAAYAATLTAGEATDLPQAGSRIFTGPS